MFSIYLTLFPIDFSPMKSVIFLILILTFYTTVQVSIFSAIFVNFKFNLNIYLVSTHFRNIKKKTVYNNVVSVGLLT